MKSFLKFFSVVVFAVVTSSCATKYNPDENPDISLMEEAEFLWVNKHPELDKVRVDEAVFVELQKPEDNFMSNFASIFWKNTFSAQGLKYLSDEKSCSNVVSEKGADEQSWPLYCVEGKIVKAGDYYDLAKDKKLPLIDARIYKVVQEGGNQPVWRGVSQIKSVNPEVIAAVRPIEVVNNKAKYEIADAIYNMDYAMPLLKRKSPGFLWIGNNAEGRSLKSRSNVKFSIVTKKMLDRISVIMNDTYIGEMSLSRKSECCYVYEKEYRITSKDKTRVINSVLYDISSYNQKNKLLMKDPNQGFSIDTQKPFIPVNIKAKKTGGDVKVSWTGPKTKEKLSFNILKSNLRSRGYKKIAIVEGEFYLDKNVKHKNNFYLVQSVDAAGNVSLVGIPVKAK
jgi:hypothetical protein